MKSLGRLTAMLILTAAVCAVVLGVRSIPDIKRYREMRQM